MSLSIRISLNLNPVQITFSVYSKPKWEVIKGKSIFIHTKEIHRLAVDEIIRTSRLS